MCDDVSNLFRVRLRNSYVKFLYLM